MSDKSVVADDAQIEGSMFLFEHPELLSKELHAGLGISPSDKPYEFAKKVRAVPISMGEAASAQKHFPLVFSNIDNPTLIAVLGVLDDVNLFIDDEGNWETNAYVPVYMRCYPFAFARDKKDKMAVIIDRAAQTVSESPATPFFDGDQLSPEVRQRVEMSGKFESERRATEKFCQKLQQYGLLAKQQASYKTPDADEEVVVADYVSIDTRKFAALDKDTLFELHQENYLYPIISTMSSLENWQWLMSLRLNRQAEKLAAGQAR